MALADPDIRGFIRVVRSWHQLPLWPPRGSSAAREPPAGDVAARELIDWTKAQVARRAADQDAAASAALRRLSSNQLCMLTLCRHPDAFLRLRDWQLFLDTVEERPEWASESQRIRPATQLLRDALRRLPPLPTGTPACRLVVDAIVDPPRAVRFSIALADLMSPEAGEAALADARREYPDSAFSLVVHDDISACAVDVRPVIGTHQRAMRTHPRVALPMQYVAHSGVFNIGGDLPPGGSLERDDDS
jgi:hypothetical protein